MPTLHVSRAGLTPAQVEIVTQALPVVGSSIEKITPNFYKCMFAAHPELMDPPRSSFRRGPTSTSAVATVFCRPCGGGAA